MGRKGQFKSAPEILAEARAQIIEHQDIPLPRISLWELSLSKFIQGDAETARDFLREHINKHTNVSELARQMGVSRNNLHRMLGPKGNPTMKSLAKIYSTLLNYEGVKVSVKGRETEEF